MTNKTGEVVLCVYACAWAEKETVSKVFAEKGVLLGHSFQEATWWFATSSPEVAREKLGLDGPGSRLVSGQLPEWLQAAHVFQLEWHIPRTGPRWGGAN